MIQTLVFEPANLEELENFRNHEGYRFTIYDGGFAHTYNNDARLFLLNGRELIFSSIEMSEERLMLAKAQIPDSSVCLYVDRDYYELTLRDLRGSTHILNWQFAEDWRGLTMDDLEYFMAFYLFNRNAKPKTKEVTIEEKPHSLEFWEEGEEPEIIRKMEDLIEDSLI